MKIIHSKFCILNPKNSRVIYAETCNFIKKETLVQVLSCIVYFAKSLRIPFLKEHLWWLLLNRSFYNIFKPNIFILLKPGMN